MKLYFKILFIVLFIIIGVYSIFIFEESTRLLNNSDSKPLIVIREEKGKNLITYRSLGFKLTKNSIVGSLLFPIFVNLTSGIEKYIVIDNSNLQNDISKNMDYQDDLGEK